MARPRAASLRARLALSFAGLAVLTAGVIGLVLVPVLTGHYATAEEAYLATGAERAVRDLAVLDWSAPAAVRDSVSALAVITQARVTATDVSGAVVAQAGPPTAPALPGGPRPLADPLGAGLFGGSVEPGTLPRSSLSITLPVLRKDVGSSTEIGTVTIDQAPDYPQAAFATVIEAWALASLVGILAAALAGLLVARWLARPLDLLTETSERMAAGDLRARAAVRRGDEVGRLATSFNVMAERTQETVTSLRRFVADAAHEIGTPLTALQADLELADAHAGTDDERRLVRRAMAQAERLGVLATGLLRLARLESGVGAERKPVDLVVVVRAVADAAASRLDQAGLDLRLVLPAAPVTVTGDAERLRTAVGYLLDNAAKFTPAGGTVTVTVEPSAGRARLVVADTGIGIPPDDLPHLFDRFHRGRNAAAYPGSGLGLAVVRATAESHGGQVAARSVPGGTELEMDLPAA
jgi:signal transduction histidine kinase